MEENLHEGEPATKCLGVGQGLQDVGPQHPRAPIGQAFEVVDEGVLGYFGFLVDEYLQVRDGLRVDNEHLLQVVPLDVEGGVGEGELEGALHRGQEGVQGGIGQEFVVGVVFVLVAPQRVDVVALGLVEQSPLDGLERSPPEDRHELFHEQCVFEGAREYYLLGIEPLESGDGLDVGHPLDDLGQLDFPRVEVVAGHADFVGAVLDNADDVLSPVVLPAGGEQPLAIHVAARHFLGVLDHFVLVRTRVVVGAVVPQVQR